jgi:hypothetical protein
MDTIDCPKCEHEHEPSGTHEEDSGEMECEECGFKFNVTVEYTPEYYIICVVHEFGEPKVCKTASGTEITGCFCKYCGKYDNQQKADST